MSQATPQQLEAVSQAVAALKKADYVIVAAGAGFSQDSGLPTYEECLRGGIPYEELCRPELIYEDPAASYGWWANSVKNYRNTQPHEGYRIIERLLGPLAKERKVYLYTSNVDGHFRHLKGFPLCEIHGCCEEWMCSSKLPYAAVELCREEMLEDMVPDALDPTVTPLGSSRFAGVREVQQRILASQGRERGCETPLIYSPPVDWEMDMEPNTMPTRARINGDWPISAERPSQIDWTHAPPVCRCGLPLRPCVLMFADEDAGLCRHLKKDAADYQEWEDAMEAQIEANGKGNVVILELGVGRRVEVVRQECFWVMRDVASKGGNATMIRINPDPKLVASYGTTEGHHVICLEMGGIEGLQQIEASMSL